MNLFARLTVWLALAICTTACLTVEENYTFNKDGSGRMELVIDMGQLAGFVEEGPQRDSMLMMGGVFEEMVPSLEELDGITSVETFTDKESLRIGIRYRFTNINALNKALANTVVFEGKGEDHAFFVEKDGTYTRTALPASDGVTLVDGIAQSFMGQDADPSQVEMVLGIMKYETNYLFPERVKVVYTEAEAEVSGAERDSVNVTSTFNDLLSDSKQLDASFVLK